MCKSTLQSVLPFHFSESRKEQTPRAHIAESGHVTYYSLFMKSDMTIRISWGIIGTSVSPLSQGLETVAKKGGGGLGEPVGGSTGGKQCFLGMKDY